MRISDTVRPVPESPRPRFDNPPVIQGESALYIGDAQIPYHDAAFINRAKDLALAWGIKRCVWGGDMLDMDAFSIFITQQGDASRELDDAEIALTELASGFEEIDWLWGNHEDRLRKALGQWLSADRVRKMMGQGTNVKAHDYYHLLVGDDWIITHPKNTSVIPARVAVWLSEKFNKNVGMFHNHVCGSSQTRDGLHIGIDIGMCADPMRLEYNAIRLGTRPAMTQGALILRYDSKEKKYYPHHLTQWTDWEFEREHGQEQAKETRVGHAARLSRRTAHRRRRGNGK